MKKIELIIRRGKPSITKIQGIVLYPGINKLTFNTVDEKKGFLKNSELKAGCKMMHMVVIDEDDIDENDVEVTKGVREIVPVVEQPPVSAPTPQADLSPVITVIKPETEEDKLFRKLDVQISTPHVKVTRKTKKK